MKRLELDLEHLKERGALHDFLGPDPEAKALLSCYEKKGTSKEVMEWWKNICERTLPNFPEPLPGAVDASEAVSRWSNKELRCNCRHPHNIGNKHGIWNAIVDQHYKKLLLDDSIFNEYELWQYRDTGRAAEISMEIYNEGEDKILQSLLFCSRNVEENNIEPADSLRLSILDWLCRIVAVATYEKVDKRELYYMETAKETLKKMPKRGRKSVKVGIIYSKQDKGQHIMELTYNEVRRKIGMAGHMGEIERYLPKYKPLFDYFGIKGDVSGLFAALDVEYKKHNP